MKVAGIYLVGPTIPRVAELLRRQLEFWYAHAVRVYGEDNVCVVSDSEIDLPHYIVGEFPLLRRLTGSEYELATADTMKFAAFRAIGEPVLVMDIDNICKSTFVPPDSGYAIVEHVPGLAPRFERYGDSLTVPRLNCSLQYFSVDLLDQFLALVEAVDIGALDETGKPIRYEYRDIGEVCSSVVARLSSAAVIDSAASWPAMALPYPDDMTGLHFMAQGKPALYEVIERGEFRWNEIQLIAEPMMAVYQVPIADQVSLHPDSWGSVRTALSSQDIERIRASLQRAMSASPDTTTSLPPNSRNASTESESG